MNGFFAIVTLFIAGVVTVRERVEVKIGEKIALLDDKSGFIYSRVALYEASIDDIQMMKEIFNYCTPKEKAFGCTNKNCSTFLFDYETVSLTPLDASDGCYVVRIFANRVVEKTLIVEAGVVGMSQATQEFFRCSPPAWTAADHVQVSCDDIKIAQYCAHGHHSCRKINKPGVLLEKAENQTLCLNITNCSYDSQSCVANAFINYTKQEPNSFTINVCNRSTSTPSDSGNNESHTDIIPPGGAGAIAAAVVLVVIIIGSMCILYWKVKCSRNAICGFCSPLHTCRIPPPDAVIEIGEGVL